MAFLTFVLAAVVAEEIIQLEPVGATYWGCAQYNTNPSGCQAHPECAYGKGGTTNCETDPCLKYNPAENDNGCPTQGDAGIVCKSYQYATAHDCDGTTGYYCQSEVTHNYGAGNNGIDYCMFAYLKGGSTTASCPSSVCRMGHISSGNTRNSDLCYPNPVLAIATSSVTDKCTYLDKDDCARIVSCMWNTGAAGNDQANIPLSGGQCQADACYALGVGATCNEDAPHNCTRLEEKKADGTVQPRCVNKQYNKAPNECYSLGLAWSKPTYNSTSASASNPTCSGAIPDCDSAGTPCVSDIIRKGAFAGPYCNNGKIPSSSLLINAPSVILFLVTFVTLLAL